MQISRSVVRSGGLLLYDATTKPCNIVAKKVMTLYAISDLHLANPINREALQILQTYPERWLIVAGDIGEKEEYLHTALSVLTRCFAQVLWVPGNHDLWSLPSDSTELRGEAKYRRLVTICRDYGVLTPEDPFVAWTPGHPTCRLAPTFTLYDYSFRPADVSFERAIEWVGETNVICADEVLLHTDPYPSPAAWCASRCDYAEHRLEEVANDLPLVLINHFPLAGFGDPEAHPALFTLVWDPAYRGLAHTLPGFHRCLRTFARPRHALTRQSALRGGIARLSTRLACPTRVTGIPARNLAVWPGTNTSCRCDLRNTENRGGL